MPARATRLLRVLPVLALLVAPVSAAVQVAPYFDGTFPTQAPGQTGWTVGNAFPNLGFTNPLWISQVPGTDDMVVVEKAGRILRFPRNAAVTAAEVTTALDLGASAQVSEDQGMYRIAFHPQFGGTGPHADEVFITYSFRPNHASAAPDKSFWRLSRFRWNHSGGTIDPASESVLIDQYDPHRWHNGGALNFDNDGFLLVTCGDGGGADEEFGLAQKLNGGFFGGVLRIDVDKDPARSHPIRRQPGSHSSRPSSFPLSATNDYYVPNDNPWQDDSGALLEEFYALGLRSPHSAHYDPATGDLWVGDVGQNGQEELNRVTKGGNYQWPYREGTLGGPKAMPSTVYGTDTPPVHSYGRTLGGCVISGVRYRGERWAAELGGKILFGDLLKGNLSVFMLGDGEAPRELVPDIGGVFYNGFSNICTDTAGEIYVPKIDGSKNTGKILILQAQGELPEPPALLSQTGLFTDTAALTPAPAMLPFEVNTPLWSDGAEKQRWIILPCKEVVRSFFEKIAWSATENWTFPAGTIFVKHFEIPLDAANPSLVKRLETRVMVCTGNGGKYGLTYRWNAQGTDAALVDGSGAEETFTITGPDGTPQQRTWSYPSRANCMECHTSVTGQSLGLRTHQIHKTVIPPGGNPVNQLAWFREQKMFVTDPTDAQINAALQARAINDEAAPLEHRVRSYLDANCAHCHQPGAAVPYFDARLATPLKSQGLVNELLKGQFHLPGGYYLKVGDPSLSAVHLRMASTTPGIAMPPFGKHVVDQQAADLLAQYISGLTDEEFAFMPSFEGRYVRLTLSDKSTISVAEIGILDGSGSEVPSSQLSVEAVSTQSGSQLGSLTIDGNPATFWKSSFDPRRIHFITLDLEASQSVGGIRFLPILAAGDSNPLNYEVHGSNDGVAWTLLGKGIVSSDAAKTWISDSAFNGRRPVRSSIAAPSHSVAAEFPVTVVFDSPVNDFAGEDLTISGGSFVAGSLRGGGYYYTGIVKATAPQVNISLAENKVNSDFLGSRASNLLSVTNALASPPIASFGSPGAVFGAFETTLSVDQAFTGLDKNDFTVTNGKLEWMIREGNTARLIFSRPSSSSDTYVTVKDAALLGENGLWAGKGFSRTFSYRQPLLEREAEFMSASPFNGFVAVADPQASGGSCRWVQEGSRGGQTGVNNQTLSGSFNLPHAGNYRIRAWTRADNADSNSFFLRVNSVYSEDFRPWETNRGAGEIGSLQYHPGFAAPAGGAPYVFPLDIGATVYLGAAEDGTRIDRMELLPERPYPLWTELSPTAAGLQAGLRFTSAVSGLTMDDFETIDGSIVAVTGSGRDYTVTFRPDLGRMYLRVKENAVTDLESGAAGIASLPYIGILADWSYEEWANSRGLSLLDSELEKDSDRDGIGQLLEYTLGLLHNRPDVKTIIPGDPSGHGLPKLVVENGPDGDQLALIYHRRIGGTPLGYIAEFGDSPTGLVPVPVMEEVTPLHPQWEEVKVREASPPATPSRFARLRVLREVE